MEDKGTADKSVYPPLTAEQNPEETHEMVTNENQEVPAADDVKFTPKVNQAGALPSVRRVNILFWSNFVGVLLLLVGFVAPGWLTVTAEHKLTYIPSSWSGRTQHIQDVYQDYALWYVIQCYPHDGKSIECETMTYRSISGIYADEVTSYEKLAIAKLENEGGDKFMFHGVALSELNYYIIWLISEESREGYFSQLGNRGYSLILYIQDLISLSSMKINVS
jgi:hypothetical protein